MSSRPRFWWYAVIVVSFGALILFHFGDVKFTPQNDIIEIREVIENTESKVTVDPTIFNINKQRGFWSGKDSVKYHLFDIPLSKALTEFFVKEEVKTLIDLGGGMGLYTKTFLANNIFTSCYDGNPHTQEISEGRCSVADLSKTVQFVTYDWVLSLEVGEHIPKEFEDTFIHNLDRLNKRGAVVSWAVEGQGGSGHVNTRNNTYVKAKFVALGYSVDLEAEKKLRDAGTFGWFKNTIMVFRRLMEKKDRV